MPLGRHLGIRVVVGELDLDDPEAVATAVPRLADELGGIDRFIANAGIGESFAVGTGHAARNWAVLTTTVLPGFIATDINTGRRGPSTLDLPTGVAALTAAIEREPVRAHVPEWPWRPVAGLLRELPLRVVRRLT